ncbi:MAG: helix-turn-helix domain-containing protein [Spirochaetia bacterium]|nr:helix-turn-helix domain-containing protein [Spirochaetia bacterium]
MESKVFITKSDDVLPVAKALSSPLRIKMLHVLRQQAMNIQNLAKELDILTSTCTMNIQVLERVGLLETEMVPAVRGSQKMCRLIYSEVVLPLLEEEEELDENTIVINMPIGLYTDFKVHPSCGMISETEIIDYLDSERAFFSPKRGNAQLIWFTDGFIEYSFPVNIPKERSVKSIQITTEICAEFPGYKEDWPSDITMWINSKEVGTWTSPGDMGGKRGRFTPKWWGLENTQYGFLKSWRVTNDGAFIDGINSAPTKIEDLHLQDDYRIRVRLGIKEEAEFRGGLNIFGEKFGNHPTGIVLQIEMAYPANMTERAGDE